MSLLHASTPSFFAALLLTACVATEPGSLGDLDTGNDDGPTTSAGSTDDGATTVGDSGEPDACLDPAHAYFEPWTEACADPGIPLLPEAGCYATCGPGAPCTVGVCTQVQTIQDDCGAECCGLIIELCVGNTPDTVCDQIVGTTFSSVDEHICGPTPKGEDPFVCHYWIDFEEDGSLLWMEADFGQGGTYTCEGGVLALDDSFEVDFSFDPATGILTWNGVEYRPDALCVQIVGTTFSSVDELECGLGPEGPVPCHWQLTFEDDGDFLWMYSDVGEGGTYACRGGNLWVEIGQDVDFSFDTATGILTWDGVDYVADPA